MRLLPVVVALSSFAAAAQPVCNAERASLLFDQGPGRAPRLLQCDGQQWAGYELSAEAQVPVAATPQKSPEELAACKASCTTQHSYCLDKQCGPIAGAPCKQRCARTLAICTTGCTPRPPEPPRAAATTTEAPSSNAAPPLASRPEPAPAAPGPSAIETAGKTLDVINRGLDLFGGPAPSAGGAVSPSSPSGASASATCCVNGAGYSCPSASAVDRCSGAFMRCIMGGKSGSVCLKESPPDPSECRRDSAVTCKK